MNSIGEIVLALSIAFLGIGLPKLINLFPTTSLENYVNIKIIDVPSNLWIDNCEKPNEIKST